MNLESTILAAPRCCRGRRGALSSAVATASAGPRFQVLSSFLLVEPDEEAAQYNTSWLAERAWEDMDCEFAPNEGGWVLEGADGRVNYVSISTADKSSVAVLVTARGTSTHASMPRPDSAIFALSRALAALSRFESPLAITDGTRRFLRTLAKTSNGPLAAALAILADGTDAIDWRSRGIPVYGIYPYPITAADLTRMHGNDERVSIASLGAGTDMIYRTLVDVAARQP